MSKLVTDNTNKLPSGCPIVYRLFFLLKSEDKLLALIYMPSSIISVQLDLCYY